MGRGGRIGMRKGALQVSNLDGASFHRRPIGVSPSTFVLELGTSRMTLDANPVGFVSCYIARTFLGGGPRRPSLRRRDSRLEMDRNQAVYERPKPGRPGWKDKYHVLRPPGDPTLSRKAKHHSRTRSRKYFQRDSTLQAV